MDLGLSNARAFVGGASAGIGRAVAAALAAEGARVALCARDPARLERARAEIAAASGAECHAVAADLDAADAARAVERAAALLGGLDVLVVNSGGPRPGRFADLDDEAWRRGADATIFSSVRLV